VIATSACIAASARRLVWAVAPTGLDPGLLCEAVAEDGGTATARRWRDACKDDGRLSWERGLFEAFCAEGTEVRRALVNEQLLDLDALVQRWARVPRVAASVSTSTGFLLASLSLVASLGADAAGDAAAPGLAVGDLASAVAALAVGVAGASFSVAVHIGSSRAVGRWIASVERLIERLEHLAAGPLGSGRSTEGA